MKVIPPYPIGAVTVNGFPASTEGAWTASALYQLGAKVQVGGTTNRIYESLINNNINKAPADNLNTAWQDLGPTNPYALFDSEYGSESTGSGEITVVFEADKDIDAIGFMSMNAEQVRIIITQNGAGQYDEVHIINDALELEDKFYNNFVDETKSRVDYVVRDLPINPTSDDPAIVTLIFQGDNIAIGSVITGREANFGFTILGAKVGIRDYSKKEVDEFGNYSIVRRRFSKIITASVVVEKDDVDRLQNFMAEFRTTPLIWVLDDEYQALLVFGYYREFEIEIAYPTQSVCSLELEGLTGAGSQ